MPRLSLSVGKHWELPPPAPAQALERSGCPSWGSARHGQLSCCWTLTCVSPGTCTGQLRARSRDSQAFMEEPTSPGCTDTGRSEGGKKSQPGGWGWRLFVPFGCYRCVSCCALRQGGCTGEKWFCFLTCEWTRPPFPYSLQSSFFPQPVAALRPDPRLASDQTPVPATC